MAMIPTLALALGSPLWASPVAPSVHAQHAGQFSPSGFEADHPRVPAPLDGFWDMVEAETAPPPPADTGDTGDDGDDGDDGNLAPVALAGEPLLAYPGDTIILDGSGSYDPEGAALSYLWTVASGPEPSIKGAQTASPELVVEEPGVHHIQLVVNDGNLDSDPDLIDIVVVDPGAGTRLTGEPKKGCAYATGAGTSGAAAWVTLLLAALARRRGNQTG